MNTSKLSFLSSLISPSPPITEEEAEQMVKRALRAKKPEEQIIEFRRSPMGSIGYALRFISISLLLLIPLPLCFILGILGYAGAQAGFRSFLTINSFLIVLLALPGLVVLPFAVVFPILQFFNNWELVWKGRRILGHWYYIDFRRQCIVAKYRVFLGWPMIGPSMEPTKGKLLHAGGRTDVAATGHIPVQQRGSFTLLSRHPGRETHFEDIVNPEVKKQGPWELAWRYSDIGIPSAQVGAGDILEDIYQPEDGLTLINASVRIYGEEERRPRRR